MNKEVQVTCYGVTKTYASLEDAKKIFLEGIMNSEGSEQERYMDIFIQLEEGQLICSDQF